MNFLLDVNISPSLAKLLNRKKHKCRHVAFIGMERAKDEEIIDFAKKNDEVIITHDLDYGKLLAFSGESKPSVIIFRIHLINAPIFYKHIVLNWNEIENPLTNGAIVIIEETSIRIRKLPIVK